jgi:GNAT superfamily N-acetyltransferase
VLWPHKANTEECTIDIDERPDAMHFGAFDRERLVAVASVFKMSTDKIDFENQYRLRAMASHPDYRGKNAGKAVVLAAIEECTLKNAGVLWCDARKVALGFYEKIGFQRIDEWYDIPPIGLHQFMYYPIK